MGYPVVLALVLLAGSCYGDLRIVGGSGTSIEQYPALVQVDFLNAWSNSWSQNCAGTILNEIYVLSAAHCFEGSNYQPSQRRIRAGTSYRNSGGVVVYVTEEFKHPSYSVASRWDADITVVRLSNYLALTPVIQQGAIVYQDSVLPDNVALRVAGWGHTSQGGSFSDTLKQATIYSINNKACAEIYQDLSIPATVTSNMICAGVPDGDVDHCQGDAGSAVYLYNAVVGVASWGHGCGLDNAPGVSTAVASYSDWILSVTSSY